MRRDSSIPRLLREALQQAADNLESLKMVSPDEPGLARLKSELLAAASSQREDDPELDLTAR